MDRKQFSIRFNNAIELMLANTKSLCFNDISPKYKFIISPNDSKSQVVLDETETAYIKTLKDLNKRPLVMEEVIDLIQVGERHPLWINISVCKAEPDFTLIEMICARRLRKIEGTVNNLDKFPPFHVWVPAPTNKIHTKVKNKFDVNWRSIEEKNKSNGLLNMIKHIFSGA